MKFVLATTETQTTDVLENVEKTFLEKYMDGAMPNFLDFTIDVILAFVVFFVGGKIIKWMIIWN